MLTHGQVQIEANARKAAASPTHQALCALVVTHQPDAGLALRLNCIARQVSAVIIVDNGSADPGLLTLSKIAQDAKFDLRLNRANLGVARALNIGMERAAMRGFSWVLLLDQDTRVDADIVANLFALHAAFPHKDRLAVIGSGFHDATTRAPVCRCGEPSGPLWEHAESVITSGSLLSVQAYAAIGRFRDEFFIDCVDFEYCLRATAQGYYVINSRRSLMSHAVGAPTQHRLFGATKWTTNHSPARRYYIARNNTVLLRESGRYRRGLWVLKSLLRCFRLCRRVVLFETQKTLKVRAVIQGWWDGVRGRMGPMQPS